MATINGSVQRVSDIEEAQAQAEALRDAVARLQAWANTNCGFDIRAV